MGRKNTIGQQIAKYREKQKISRVELAKKCGWSENASKGASRISNYEYGMREPSYEDIKIIAKALNINPGILVWGDSFLENERLKYAGEKLNKEMLPVRGIPIIGWDETTKNIGKMKMLNQSTEFVYFPADESNSSMYALIIKNDAMSATAGNQKSFTPGEAIIVDPTNVELVSGKYLVAAIGDNVESIFRKYVEEGGKAYLLALNNVYPAIEFSSDIEVIGTVIGASWRV